MLTLRTGTGIRFSAEFRISFDAGIDIGRISNNLLSNSWSPFVESLMRAFVPKIGCFRMDLYFDGETSVADGVVVFDVSLPLLVIAALDGVREIIVAGARNLIGADALIVGVFLIGGISTANLATEITGLLPNFLGVNKSYRFVFDGENSLLFNVDEIKSYGLIFVCKIDRLRKPSFVALGISLADARLTVALGIKLFRCDRTIALFDDVTPLLTLRNKRDASLLTSGIEFRCSLPLYKSRD